MAEEGMVATRRKFSSCQELSGRFSPLLLCSFISSGRKANGKEINTHVRLLANTNYSSRASLSRAPIVFDPAGSTIRDSGPSSAIKCANLTGKFVVHINNLAWRFLAYHLTRIPLV